MNIVMRYIHRNKNKMKRSVLAFIIITIAVAACAFIGSYGAVKVLAAQTDTDAAVPAGVVEEKKLTINKRHMFSPIPPMECSDSALQRERVIL